MTPRDGNCTRCGAQIKWVKSKPKDGSPGSWCPLEMRPLQVMSDDGTMHRGRESHYASCPYAQDFRADVAKKKAAGQHPPGMEPSPEDRTE